MTLDQFRTSLNSDIPPQVNKILLALWYEARGEWPKAHEIVQEMHTKDAAWIHAYLHRKEGDYSNAGYWYHRAGQPLPNVATDREWEMISEHLLRKK